MRGSPLMQTLLVVLAFVLAGVPVWRLTRPAAPDAAPQALAGTTPTVAEVADPADAKPAPLDVEAVFAPAPTDFQIKNLDQTVLAGRGPKARFTTRWTVAVPSDGVDLVVRAHWSAMAAADGSSPAGAVPGENPAAARITVRFVDGRSVEKSFWAAADGVLAEVFTVPGAPLSTAAP